MLNPRCGDSKYAIVSSKRFRATYELLFGRDYNFLGLTVMDGESRLREGPRSALLTARCKFKLLTLLRRHVGRGVL